MNPQVGHFRSSQTFMRHFRGKWPVKRHFFLRAGDVSPSYPPLDAPLYVLLNELHEINLIKTSWSQFERIA